MEVSPPPLSLARRYVVTIAANCIRGLFLYLAGIVIARALSPDAYGNYAYLLAIFVALNSLLDAGGNGAFYTFISQQPRTFMFVLSYYVWQFVQIAGVLIGIWLMPTQWGDLLWPGISTSSVCVAFVAVFCQYQLWNSISALGDAVRNTVWVQLFNIIVTGIYCLAIVISAQSAAFSIDKAFAILLGSFMGVALPVSGFYLYYLQRTGFFAKASTSPLWVSVKAYYSFCAPLAINGAIVFAGSFIGRWLVQRFAGSEAQGYFSAGQHIAMPALLLSTSLARLVWKEIAEAKGEEKHQEISAHFRTTVFGLTAVNALWICFLLPWMDYFVEIALGSSYREGAGACAILLFASLFQALGQVVSVFYYATHRTRVFSFVVCCSSVLEIISTFIFLVFALGSSIGMSNHVGVALLRFGGQVLAVAPLIALFVVGGRELLLKLFCGLLLLVGYCYGLRSLVDALTNSVMLGVGLAFSIYLCSVLGMVYMFGKQLPGYQRLVTMVGMLNNGIFFFIRR